VIQQPLLNDNKVWTDLDVEDLKAIQQRVKDVLKKVIPATVGIQNESGNDYAQFGCNFGVLALGTVLFLICMLGIGLFISTVSSTQQQAMVTAFFFIMPAIIFSGFVSPISSMPEALQWLTYLNPLRYFQVVLRSVFLKGVGLGVLWPEMAAMAALGIMMLTISVLRFQKSLD
jgi:ABC-type transport system involved in multi-copper enzyme maturation permease subunit